MRIGVAGAGVAGRLSAFLLSRAGHQVTVFEASASASPSLGSVRAAGWTAAGMLSPIAEMESGGEIVRELGQRSLTLWQSIQASADLGLSLHDSLMVCHAQDLGSAQRVLRLLSKPPTGIEQLSGEEARALAPFLKGTLYAWRLIGEGHLHPAQAMQSLYEQAPGVQWQFGSSAHQLTPGRICTASDEHAFDWILDCRGTGAAQNDSGQPVRGVRGEVIVLHAPGFVLERPVRLLHPRWRVYIVPRPHEQIVIGATEIESEDRSAISVQSTLELLGAAFSIFPALAEARLVHTDVNLRPATPDNLPLISVRDGHTVINGLFRHGWLLAPAVVERALQQSKLL